ncbi:MAG: 50S ribosomal protein L5 [candidate division Zixibacteria bacterium]|nr:50S ribosomal protein L5 [candidate division Zixibacteria bacterium]
MPELKDKYLKVCVPALMKRFGYKNMMQVPRMSKIVVNCGVGDATQNAKIIETVVAEMATITGQKPTMRRAKKAISNFKLKEGSPVGVMVTLRGDHMYEFMTRLISAAMPRIRDFRGVPNDGFDGRGNYNLGLSEQVDFPEINYDKIAKVRGMNITFVTSAETDEEGLELLASLGMPFRK